MAKVVVGSGRAKVVDCTGRAKAVGGPCSGRGTQSLREMGVARWWGTVQDFLVEVLKAK